MLQELFPCTWDSPSITYLGIQLTHPTSNLYTTNYLPLLLQIQKEFVQLSKIHLTWVGRIAAYQMQILPKLLYLFRTIPIPIPNKFFKNLASSLNKFIWQNKKPRVALSTLYKHKKIGGGDLPNAQGYYQASLLDQAKYWFSCQEDNLWPHIEHEITPGHDLTALLMASTIHHKPFTPPYPTIQATLTAWSLLIRNQFPNEILFKLNIPLTTYEYLIHNFSTHHWKQKGIHFSTDDIVNPTALDILRIQ